MRVRSRRGTLALVLFIGMLEAVLTQRAGAQWRMEVLPGVRFGPPLKAGLAVGATYGTRTALAQFAGPMVLGEAGIGGGRVSAGYMLAFPFASGVEVLGTAIRTWGSPSQVPKRTTLVGGELRMSYFAINVGLGVYRPAGSGVADRRTLFHLNVGLGI